MLHDFIGQSDMTIEIQKRIDYLIMIQNFNILVVLAWAETVMVLNHYRHPTAHGFQDGYLDLRGLADIKVIHLFHGLMVFLNQFHGMTVELYPFLRKDRKSTRLNSSHVSISYAVFCLKKNI